ncbi:unnamed protein product [Hymenolepis diminuta]|uniref:30S ribosomal protein S18 n=1 Tax=Hymenolepis diminuta TaxID=6216 RepID=A0A0R3SGQ4_HYMDI|nr:unnamed protein product [Hymenolepis diminuta]
MPNVKYFQRKPMKLKKLKRYEYSEPLKFLFKSYPM